MRLRSPLYLLVSVSLVSAAPRQIETSRRSGDVEDAESTRGGAYITGTNLTFVTGIFVVPEARVPSAGPTANDTAALYGASLWVGLGGYGTANSSAAGCPGSSAPNDSSAVVFRTGVDIFWDSEAGPNYQAWAQWYPGPSSAYANFSVTAGDVVRLSALVPAGGSGDGAYAEVENLSSGETGRQVFNNSGGQAGGQSLCGSSAEWIVEDFNLPGGPPGVPIALANFTSIEFEGAEAVDGGRLVGTEGAFVFDVELQAQGGRLTSCGMSESNVVCSRVVEAEDGKQNEAG